MEDSPRRGPFGLAGVPTGGKSPKRIGMGPTARSLTRPRDRSGHTARVGLLSAAMTHEDRALFAEALRFALEAHGDQKRKGNDVPYVSHLVQVAGLVLEQPIANKAVKDLANRGPTHPISLCRHLLP